MRIWGCRMTDFVVRYHVGITSVLRRCIVAIFCALVVPGLASAQDRTLGDVFDFCEPVVSGAALPSLEALPLKRLDDRTMIARLNTTSGPVSLRYFRDAGGSSPVTRCWVDGYDARDQDNLTDPGVIWVRSAREIRAWFVQREARPDAQMVSPVIGAAEIFMEICTESDVPLIVLAGPNSVQSDVPDGERPFEFSMMSPVNNNSTECKYVK